LQRQEKESYVLGKDVVETNTGVGINTYSSSVDIYEVMTSSFHCYLSATFDDKASNV
jgi:hypothetical protein